jgi:hypothetical protein
MLHKITRGSAAKNEDNITTKRAMATVFSLNETPGLRHLFSRTEIQSKSFPGHDCTRNIQRKCERQMESRQESTGRADRQFHVP